MILAVHSFTMLDRLVIYVRVCESKPEYVGPPKQAISAHMTCPLPPTGAELTPEDLLGEVLYQLSRALGRDELGLARRDRADDAATVSWPSF